MGSIDGSDAAANASAARVVCMYRSVVAERVAAVARTCRGDAYTTFAASGDFAGSPLGGTLTVDDDTDRVTAALLTVGYPDGLTFTDVYNQHAGPPYAIAAVATTDPAAAGASVEVDFTAGLPATYAAAGGPIGGGFQPPGTTPIGFGLSDGRLTRVPVPEPASAGLLAAADVANKPRPVTGSGAAVSPAYCSTVFARSPSPS